MGLLVSSMGLFAQPPKDIAGWGKLTWSMQPTQAKALYADHTVQVGLKIGDITVPDMVVIKDVDIDGMPVDVHLQFDKKTNNLIIITLDPGLKYKPAPTGELAAMPMEREMAFGHFKTLLIGKYGAPANEERKPTYDLLNHPNGTQTTLMWAFPSTTIKLEWDEERFSVGVTVRYYAATKNNPM